MVKHFCNDFVGFVASPEKGEKSALVTGDLVCSAKVMADVGDLSVVVKVMNNVSDLSSAVKAGDTVL